jgi:hypothetical protein
VGAHRAGPVVRNRGNGKRGASWRGVDSASDSQELVLHREEGGAEVDCCLAGVSKLDGGWSWAGADPSDPLAAGQALFGLAQGGLNSEHVAIKGQGAFLVETQRDDGSWWVLSTKES